MPEFEDELIIMFSPGNLQELDDCLLHPLIATVLRDFVATNADVLALPKGKTESDGANAICPRRIAERPTV